MRDKEEQMKADEESYQTVHDFHFFLNEKRNVNIAFHNRRIRTEEKSHPSAWKA